LNQNHKSIHWPVILLADMTSIYQSLLCKNVRKSKLFLNMTKRYISDAVM